MNSLFATYDDISDCWPTFKHNIEGFFPLRNVYKPKLLGASENNTLIRNIPIINLKFIPLKAELLSFKSIMNLNERPYLHIFIGFCEDIDVYRQQFRPKLKAWLESLSIRKNHQYMVILIENQSQTNESNKNVKAFLLDKIRFDFNDKVTLKLISLKLLPGEILNSIPECIDLISDCVYQSAIMNLNQLDDDIRVLAGQKSSADWNFFTFFQTKESKALILTELGLLSEAIACYDELETLYLEIDSSDSPIKFKTMITSIATIKGADLSASNYIKYRELINTNEISKYEFEAYLISRQIYLFRDLKDFIRILKRCKEYVCRALIVDESEKGTKDNWTTETIFYILKVIDLDSAQVQSSAELSNLLSDVLFIASSQIKLNFEVDFDKSTFEQIFDLSQILEYSKLMEPDELIQFKISIMRYCLSLLKGSIYTHKKVIISLELSDIYYELKNFNVALELLQEASELAQNNNWPSIQLLLMRKSCDCYWNLEMPREFLRKIFEMIQIPGYNKFDDGTYHEKVEKAAYSLDDILSFKFENFFNINDVIIKQTANDLIQLHIETRSNYVLPVEKCDLLITLYGEKEDIVFDALNVKIQANNHIVADLSMKEERPSENHRLKSIILNFGKLQFKSDSVTNIWNQSIKLLPSGSLSVIGLIPEHFNFADPYIIIRCRNNKDRAVNNLVLNLFSSILDLNPILDINTHNFKYEKNDSKVICVDNLPPNSDFEVKYKINKYIHGRHIIKVTSSLNCEKNNRTSISSMIEIDLPESWNIKHFTIKSSKVNIEAFKISPNANHELPIRNIKFLNLDDQNNHTPYDYNYEIEPNSDEFCIVNSPPSQQAEIILPYCFDNDESIRSVSFPVDTSIVDILYCTVIPVMKSSLVLKLGSIVNFEVKLEGNVELENIPFSLIYNPSQWMLSGSSNGLSKENWCFDMIPIHKGLIQIPGVKFSTSLPVHVFSAGSTVFVTVP